MTWRIVDQSPADPGEGSDAAGYRITLRDTSGREAKVNIQGLEGASLSASDARAAIEPHLNDPVLPDHFVFGADWPNI